MSLLGFDDGGYIEIVSVRQPGWQSPWWQNHVVANSGPSGWAVEVGDVAVVAGRLRSLGVRVDGPHHMQRSRPEGVVVEWDLAFIGEHGAGAMHPVIIAVMVEGGEAVGRGRNRRVQGDNLVSHGEIDCMKNAARRPDYSKVTMYTTLSPCMMRRHHRAVRHPPCNHRRA